MLHTFPHQKVPTPVSGDKVLMALLVLGVGAVAGAITILPAWFLSMSVIPAEVIDKAEVMLWLYFLLVPIATAGAFWIQLFRLRSVKGRRSWLEALGFSFVFLLVMPILLGMGAYALQMQHLPSFGDSSNPWSAFVLYVQAPTLMLYALLEALITSGVAYGSAKLFADWDMIRDKKLPGRAWLEFLLVFGCVTLAAFLTGLAFVFCNAFWQDAFGSMFMYVFIPVPGLIVACIASWTTYRRLRKVEPVKSNSTGNVSVG